ncbi:HalOD1 output domain-containing protein [Halovivax sp.]|uniref:HalOD1 output domain-containing protein n=1 Tax=Halovivax sp. TaxID=1935978 RepID=UPI0025C0CA5E|nr:HalOD1 output domain-containing protein [Halovivax sp.]
MNATNGNSHGAKPKPRTATTIRHDWDEDDSLAVTIVSAIARLAGTEPEDVPQLYERIDPDSLEALFAPSRRGGVRNGGHLWFSLDEYGVTVYGDGTVIVRRLE